MAKGWLRPALPVGVVLALAASSLAVVRPALAASVQPAASPASPAAPFITSVAGEGLGILVDWTPASASEGVTTYRLTATPVLTSSVPPSCKSAVSASTPGTDTTTVLGHVCSGVAYEVTMKAVTASGTSAPSAVSNPIVPLTARAPFVPLVTNVLGRNHSLVISWSPPAYDGGKPLTGYELTVIGSGSTKSIGVGATAASATITGLKNGATYRVVLSALNAVGSSPASTALGEPMPDGAPSTPSDLSVVPDSAAASISVSWVAPVNDGGLPVTSYRLTRLEEVATANSAGVVSYAKAAGAKPVTTVLSGTSTTVKGLSTKSVFYVFAVAARNSLGSSPATAYSEPVTLRTAVAAGAVVVLPSVLAQLGSVNNGTLTWMYPSSSSVPSQVKSLKKGEVLVCGISKLTPDGLLVRVTSVTVKAPATYVVTMTSAPLSSAFSTLTTQTALNPLSPGAGSAIASARAAHFVATSPGVEIEHASVGFSKSVTLSVNESASGSVQASLNGTVSFTPSLEFEASILHGFLHVPDGATMSFSASLRAEVSATLTASASYDQRWLIGEIEFPPIPVGDLPLVLVPTIPIFLELSANGQVGATASVSLSYGAKASWTSKHPSVLSLSDLSQSPSNLTPSVSVLVDAHGSVGVEAQPQLLIDDVTGPEVDATLTLAAALSPLAKSPSPWLALTLNLQVKAGWTIDLLVWSGTVQGTLASHTWTLYTAVGTPSVKPPLTVSPAVVSVNPGSSEKFSVAGATGSVRWSLTGAAGDTITSSGLFTAAAPGGRAIVVTATDSSGESGSATVLVGTVIGPPQDLSAARDSAGTSAAVFWEPPVSVPGATIASYSVSTSPQTAVTTTAANASGATISGLDPTTTYLVSVSATTTSGFESPPVTVMLAVGGTWTAMKAPAPDGAASDPKASLGVLACPSVGSCVATGYYVDASGDGQGLIETLSSGTWTAMKAPVPAGAASNSYASPDALACPSVGSCVATGRYYDSNDEIQGLIEMLSNGTWTATEAPLPPGAASDSSVDFLALACPSVGSCVATGYYVDASGDGQGLIETLSSGTWTAMKAPVPAGAASDPATWLSAVACPSVGSCVATGRYFDPSFDSQIVIETLSAGTWTAMKAPFPPGAVASHGNTGPGVLACASVGSCVATGSYTDSNDRRQGFIDTLSDGTWTAMKAPVPAGAASWPAALLGALACPSVGSCVLTGTYVDSNGDLQDLIDTLSDGTWTAMKAPAPDGAASDPNAFLRVLACPSVGSCVATGYYGDASGDGQGLIETLSSGTWTPTEAPLPLGAASDPDAGLEGALACPSVGSCVATGVYTDSSGDQEGLIEEMG